jgi:hypothetical protein
MHYIMKVKLELHSKFRKPTIGFVTSAYVLWGLNYLTGLDQNWYWGPKPDVIQF